MLITKKVPMPHVRNRLLGLFCFAVLAATGCNNSDAGVCCKVIPGGDESLIPEPETNASGDPKDVVSQHPVFDCNDLVCVAYKGKPAYCTTFCRDASDCPEGFACEPILESEPPAGSQLGPDDKFCVKVLEQCLED